MQYALEWIQWPAMVITIIASYLVSSSDDSKRNISFWLFLVSNALWITWSIEDSAYALIILQICLALLNIIGAYKTAHSKNQDASLNNPSKLSA
jgi:hypothetical protein